MASGGAWTAPSPNSRRANTGQTVRGPRWGYERRLQLTASYYFVGSRREGDVKRMAEGSSMTDTNPIWSNPMPKKLLLRGGRKADSPGLLPVRLNVITCLLHFPAWESLNRFFSSSGAHAPLRHEKLH